MTRIKFLFSVLLLLTAGASYAQTITDPASHSPKITLPAKPRTVPVINVPPTAYSVWKTGRFISPSTLGGDPEMFHAVVNDCWSVTYGGYALVANEGMLSMELRVQNKKKYMVTIHYATGSYLKLEAKMQYDCDTKNCSSNSVQETMDFYPEPSNHSFSFIIEPDVENANPANNPPAGSPATALMEISIPSVKTKQAGKSGRDYYLNYTGMDVKEVE